MSTSTQREGGNGVDVPALFGTINAVGEQPELAKFQFRATNRWLVGTHNRTTIEAFHGAGREHEHTRRFAYDADHPTVLMGTDEGPSAPEFLLHALAACLTSGIANVASARGVTLTSVESTIEGDIDLLGMLGLSDDVRNGYQRVRVSFRIAGNASEAKLREIVEQSRLRSPVYDVLTNGVGVDVAVHATTASREESAQ